MAQPEWATVDYYKALGVPKTASADEIRKAFRKLAVQYHPDTSKEKHAGDKFREINTAYETLSDATKRQEYDAYRRVQASGPFGGVGTRINAPGGQGFAGRTTSFNIDDLIGSIFDGREDGPKDRVTGFTNPFTSTPPRAAAPKAATPRKGGDVETEVTLKLEDALAGVTVTLRLSGSAACSRCKGSGTKLGTKPRVCPDCNGESVVTDNQGMFGLTSACKTCMGRGSIIDQPCARCAGSGVENRPRTIKAKLPKGVHDGQAVRLRGKGEPGRNGGAPGDLFVTVHVTPHPVWGREGDNLTMVLPITFAEASLGAKVGVPTIDGEIHVKIAPGTESGKVLRLRNRGAPTGSGEERGDLLVTIRVAVPPNLTSAQRKLVQDFATIDSTDPRAALRRAAAQSSGNKGEA